MRAFLIGVIVVVAALAGAFFAFSTPDIPRATLEAKYAAPPSQFLLLPDGSRAHVRDRGPRGAPVLVLVHGSDCSLFDWEPWATRLDGNFRVVTMDMPGYGLTGAVPSGDYSQEAMVAFVKAVVDKLGIGRFAIGGHSMGGGVAARFAETWPGRVTQLILVDAVGMPAKLRQETPAIFRILRLPVLNQILLHVTPRSFVADSLNDDIVHKSVLTNAMIDRYWDFIRMAGTREAEFARRGLPKNTYVLDHIAGIKAPTLILWGDDDHDVPVSDAHAYAEKIPGAKLIIYKATGHFPHEEVADQSAADARAFLVAGKL